MMYVRKWTNPLGRTTRLRRIVLAFWASNLSHKDWRHTDTHDSLPILVLHSAQVRVAMTNLWKKLNLKNHAQVVITKAHERFEGEIDSLSSIQVVRSCGKSKQIVFLLAFVTKRSEIKRVATQVAKKAEGDPIIWFAYPKQTSKKYTCNFNRDSGWEPVTQAGFEGVRMVAIDEDWSALRFRRTEFVKRTGKRQSKR